MAQVAREDFKFKNYERIFQVLNFPRRTIFFLNLCSIIWRCMNFWNTKRVLELTDLIMIFLAVNFCYILVDSIENLLTSIKFQLIKTNFLGWTLIKRPHFRCRKSNKSIFRSTTNIPDWFKITCLAFPDKTRIDRALSSTDDFDSSLAASSWSKGEKFITWFSIIKHFGLDFELYIRI